MIGSQVPCKTFSNSFGSYRRNRCCCEPVEWVQWFLRITLKKKQHKEKKDITGLRYHYNNSVEARTDSTYLIGYPKI